MPNFEHSPPLKWICKEYVQYFDISEYLQDLCQMIDTVSIGCTKLIFDRK